MHYSLYLVSGLVLAFLAFQFYPYFKLKASRGQAAPALNEALNTEQMAQSRMLFYFMAPQCGMCKNITPIVDQLATERNDVIRIDASEKPEIAHQFKIMGTPAFVLVNNGMIEKVKLGGMSRRKILKILESG